MKMQAQAQGGVYPESEHNYHSVRSPSSRHETHRIAVRATVQRAKRLHYEKTGDGRHSSHHLSGTFGGPVRRSRSSSSSSSSFAAERSAELRGAAELARVRIATAKQSLLLGGKLELDVVAEQDRRLALRASRQEATRQEIARNFTAASGAVTGTETGTGTGPRSYREEEEDEDEDTHPEMVSIERAAADLGATAAVDIASQRNYGTYGDSRVVSLQDEDASRRAFRAVHTEPAGRPAPTARLEQELARHPGGHGGTGSGGGHLSGSGSTRTAAVRQRRRRTSEDEDEGDDDGTVASPTGRAGRVASPLTATSVSASGTSARAASISVSGWSPRRDGKAEATPGLAELRAAHSKQRDRAARAAAQDEAGRMVNLARASRAAAAVAAAAKRAERVSTTAAAASAPRRVKARRLAEPDGGTLAKEQAAIVVLDSLEGSTGMGRGSSGSRGALSSGTSS